jgi:hypothetical protein
MGFKGYRLWAMGQLDSTCRAPPLAKVPPAPQAPPRPAAARAATAAVLPIILHHRRLTTAPTQRRLASRAPTTNAVAVASACCRVYAIRRGVRPTTSCPGLGHVVALQVEI